MVNYYETLKVSPKASGAEIKSAYRRLARKLHPDKNNGSEETARAFAAIAEAYEVLGNTKERAKYDRQLLELSFNGHVGGDSLFASTNQHAKRWRQLVYERRYNEIIDRMIEEERRESVALQKIIFPTVALFLSTLAVAIFKPQVFTASPIVIKIIFVSLFIVGLLHLVDRLREGFDRYTYRESDLHESILDDGETPVRRFSRAFAGSFLFIGVMLSFCLGLAVGHYFEFFSIAQPAMFSRSLNPEFVFYPPIFVLIVDAVHTVASQFDV
jgi:hypothetical protein